MSNKLSLLELLNPVECIELNASGRMVSIAPEYHEFYSDKLIPSYARFGSTLFHTSRTNSCGRETLPQSPQLTEATHCI